MWEEVRGRQRCAIGVVGFAGITTTTVEPCFSDKGRNPKQLRSQEKETAGGEEDGFALVCATKRSVGIIVVNYCEVGKAKE